MDYRGFIGPTNTLRSININCERTVNWFQSSALPGTPKVPVWLEPTPGVHPWVQVDPTNPIRGLFAINSRAYAACGTNFLEFYEDQTFDIRGTISNAGVSGGVGDSVFFACNGTAGNQIAMSTGGFGYIFNTDTNVFTQISDGDFTVNQPVYTVVFIDGYFVWLKALSRKIFWSNLEDGLTYDSLDVAEVSRTADDLVGMAQSHGQLWLLGQQTSDVWMDTGSTAIFAPATGGFIEQGMVAPASVANVDNTIMWLGANAKGHGIVYRADGYTPKRISTPSQEFILAQLSSIDVPIRLDSAIGFSYQEAGHEFYMLYVPGVSGTDYDTTLCYDVTMDQWHERMHPTNPEHCPTADSEFRAHVGRNQCFAFRRQFVGDRQSGTIYEMSSNFDEDHLIIGTGL